MVWVCDSRSSQREQSEGVPILNCAASRRKPPPEIMPICRPAGDIPKIIKLHDWLEFIRECGGETVKFSADSADPLRKIMGEKSAETERRVRVQSATQRANTARKTAEQWRRVAFQAERPHSPPTLDAGRARGFAVHIGCRGVESVADGHVSPPHHSADYYCCCCCCCLRNCLGIILERRRSRLVVKACSLRVRRVGCHPPTAWRGAFRRKK